MRLAVSTALVCVLLSLGATALPAENLTCWHSRFTDPDTFERVSITICSIEGEDRQFVLDEGSSLTLSPDVGIDGLGVQCWYWTTRETNWVIRSISGDVATLGWDPDGTPGGPVAVDVTLTACTTEPVAVVSDQVAVWELIRDYVHQRPDPQVDPPVGLGLTGLDTYVVVTPPEPFEATLTSPGTGATLEVHAEVSLLNIEWGDGSEVLSFTPTQFAFLTPSPEGAAMHIYETKTCAEPGGRRCHPSLDAYPLTVAYTWSAIWRTSNSPEWNVLSVPDTQTTIGYPVTEIVSYVTETR